MAREGDRPHNLPTPGIMGDIRHRPSFVGIWNLASGTWHLASGIWHASNLPGPPEPGRERSPRRHSTQYRYMMYKGH